MQVASNAGRAGLQGQGQLRQALALAKRYSIDDWALYLAFIKSLILEAPGDFKSFKHLMTSSAESLKRKSEVRPQAFPSRHNSTSFAEWAIFLWIRYKSSDMVCKCRSPRKFMRDCAITTGSCANDV